MDYNEILRKLDGNNLADTFPLIRQKAAQTKCWTLSEKVEDLWTTYNQMLQFMLQGVEDSESGTIRNDLCSRLRRLLCVIERQERIQNAPHERYSLAAKQAETDSSFDQLITEVETLSHELSQTRDDHTLRPNVRQYRIEQTAPQLEKALQDLFGHTWTAAPWQSNEAEQATRFMFSESVGTFCKATFVSAVTLSCLEYRDEIKALFLADCYLLDNPEISQRALVGLFLVLIQHNTVLKNLPRLHDRLSVYCEDKAFRDDLLNAVVQLTLTLTTDSVTSKVRDNIMPQLLKSMMEKEKKQTQDPDPLAAQDWTEWDENPKLKEMNQLQREGADIYYASFSLLKGHSFFHTLSHWFYPNPPEQGLFPAIDRLATGPNAALLRMMTGRGPFCDSDKYSLCFTFESMGSMGMDSIARLTQFEGFANLQAEAGEEMPRPTAADICRSYILSLYRFYRLYPYRTQFPDPFATLRDHPLRPYSFLNKLARTLLPNQQRKRYADFLLRKDFHLQALPLYRSLALGRPDTNEQHELLQKIGFCYQKIGDNIRSTQYYSRALQLRPDTLWTLEHIVDLYLARQRFAQAAPHCDRLLALRPDSPQHLLRVAQTRMGCQLYASALPLLHKAHYLAPHSTPIRSTLAWCLLVEGEKKQAESHIAQLPHDNLLQVLSHILKGQTSQALHLLRQADDPATLHNLLMPKLRILVRQQRITPLLVQLFNDAYILLNP